MKITLNFSEENIPMVFSVPELAKILQIGRNSAYELVKTGQIRCVRIGKNIRIPKQALIDYLNK